MWHFFTKFLIIMIDLCRNCQHKMMTAIVSMKFTSMNSYHHYLYFKEKHGIPEDLSNFLYRNKLSLIHSLAKTRYCKYRKCFSCHNQAESLMLWCLLVVTGIFACKYMPLRALCYQARQLFYVLHWQKSIIHNIYRRK